MQEQNVHCLGPLQYRAGRGARRQRSDSNRLRGCGQEPSSSGPLGFGFLSIPDLPS